MNRQNRIGDDTPLIELNSLRINDFLAGNPDRQQLLQLIANLVHTTLDVDRVRVYLHRARQLIPQAHVNMNADFLNLDIHIDNLPYWENVLQSHAAQIYKRPRDETQEYVIDRMLDRQDLDEWIRLPLVLNDRLIGLIAADNKLTKRPLAGVNLIHMESLAQLATNIIVNTLLIDALSGERARFRRIIDAWPNGIIVNDNDGRIVEANREANRILGYDAPKDLRQRSVRSIFNNPEIASQIRQRLSRSDSQTTNRELQLRHHNGHAVPVRLTTAFLGNEDGLPHYVGYFQDRTDAVQAERRIRLNSALDSLLLKNEVDTDVSASLSQVANTIVKFGVADGCRIFLKHTLFDRPERPYVSLPASSPQLDSHAVNCRFRLSEWPLLEDLTEQSNPIDSITYSNAHSLLKDWRIFFPTESPLDALILVPLRLSHGDSLGLLALEWHKRDALIERRPTNAKNIASEIGERLSSFVENSRRNRSAHHVHDMLLASINRLSSDGLSLSEIVTAASEIIDAKGARLISLNDVTGRMETVVSYGLALHFASRPVLTNGNTARVLQSGIPSFTADALDPIFNSAEMYMERGCSSCLGIPIRDDNKNVAVLWFYFDTTTEFQQDEIGVLTHMVNQSIQTNALLEATKSRQQQILDALDKVMLVAADEQATEDNVLETVAEQAHILTNTNSSTDSVGKAGSHSHVVTIRGSHLHLKAMYPSTSLEAYRKRVSEIDLNGEEPIGLCGKAVLSREPQFEPHITPATPGYIGLHSETLAEMAVPIIQNNRVIGVINVEDREPYRFTRLDLQALSTLAGHVATVLHYRRYVDALKALTESGQALRPRTLLKTVAEQMHAMIGMESSERMQHYTSIWLVDVNDQNKATAFATYPYSFEPTLKAKVPELRLDTGIGEEGRIGMLGRTIRTGKSCYEPDLQNGSNSDYIQVFDHTRSALTVPIVYQGRVLGGINVEHSALDAYDDITRRLLHAFAAKLADVLITARVQASLNEVVHAITSETKIDALIRMTSEHIWQLSNAAGKTATNCYVGLIRDDGKLYLESIHPIENFDALQSQYPAIDLNDSTANVGLTGHVARTGKPELVENVAQWQALNRPYIHFGDTVQCALSVPIKTEDRCLGAVTIEHQDENAYTNHHLQLLEQYAYYLGSAISRAEDMRQLVVSRSITRKLVDAGSLEEVLTIIMGGACELLRMQDACVKYWDPLAQDYVQAWRYTASGKKAERYLTRARPKSGWTRHAIEAREPKFVPDTLKEHNINRVLLQRGIRSVVDMPLEKDGQVFAVLSLFDKRTHQFSKQQVELLKSLANQLVRAIEHMNLLGELKAKQLLVGEYTAQKFFEAALKGWRHRVQNKTGRAADHLRYIQRVAHTSGDLVELDGEIEYALRHLDDVYQIFPEKEPLCARKCPCAKTHEIYRCRLGRRELRSAEY